MKHCNIYSILCAAMLALPGAASAQTVLKDTLGISSAAADNVTELLTGQMSGVRVSAIDGNPVGALNVNIRGLNSLRTDNQPLWIIDGAVLNTGLNQNLDAFWQYGEQSYTAALNPMAFLFANEIESIEVLKNTTATAIYGSRGANGVIIVKTKVPAVAKRVINWTSNVSVSEWKGRYGVGHNHHVGVGGANNKTSYNISANFRNITGVLPNNSSNYGGLKANFETHANNVVWFGLNALMSVGGSSSPTGTSWLGRPSMTLAMRNGNKEEYNNWRTDYDDNTEDCRALASTFITFNFTPAFHWTTTLGMDLQYNRRGIWYDNKTEFGATTPDDPTDNPNGGAGSILSSVLFNYNVSTVFSYKLFIAKDHEMNFKLGGEYIGDIKIFNTMNGRNYMSHALRAKGLSLASSPIENHKFKRDYKHFGAYFNLDYNWKKIIGLNALIRYDNTPKYSGAVQDFYPSADAYVDIKRAAGISDNVFSSLRLEGGWGKSGREQYIPYELFGNYLSGGWFVPEPATEAFYDGLTRLVTTEYNVGLKLGFLKDRLTLKAAYYDRSSDDNFTMYCLGKWHPRPSSRRKDYWDWTTASEVFRRTSTVANRGFEFDLYANIIKTGDWNWTVAANVAYNVNQMTSANVDDFPGRVVGHDVYCSANAIDLPVSSLIGYEVNPDGTYKDQTGEGVISVADKITLGNTIPLVHGGFQTTLTWKDLSLSVQLDGAAGHKIANINNLIADNPTPDSEGKIALTSKYVESGDFLRIGQIGLKYNIPVKAKWLKGLSVHFDAKNVATFTKYSGWNPDVNSFGINSLSNGFDYGSYPLARTFLLGFNVNF